MAAASLTPFQSILSSSKRHLLSLPHSKPIYPTISRAVRRRPLASPISASSAAAASAAAPAAASAATVESTNGAVSTSSKKSFKDAEHGRQYFPLAAVVGQASSSCAAFGTRCECLVFPKCVTLLPTSLAIGEIFSLHQVLWAWRHSASLNQSSVQDGFLFFVKGCSHGYRGALRHSTVWILCVFMVLFQPADMEDGVDLEVHGQLHFIGRLAYTFDAGAWAFILAQ